MAPSVLLLRIMSYSKSLLPWKISANDGAAADIRYAADPPSEGERPWSERAPRLTSQVRFNTIGHESAFIGFQEVLHTQLLDILTTLNTNLSHFEPEWTYIGVGRDDGKEAGENSPIFYRPSIWSLQNWTTIWLSPTPDRPSKGWDAGSIRILTMGEFMHRETGMEVVAMNTHLDNVGTVSRQHSAEIISAEIERRLNCEGGREKALFLTGDFNSEPTQEAYQYLTRDSSPVFDAREKIPGSQRYGNRIGSFTGFDGKQDPLLDHIFLDKRASWRPKTYAVLANKFDEGVYYSDHQAVVTDVELCSRENEEEEAAWG